MVARFPLSWPLFRGPGWRFLDSLAVGWDDGEGWLGAKLSCPPAVDVFPALTHSSRLPAARTIGAE